jgi:hypothetical protein
MKKALVVFLILAVAGGLFAEISWSGNAQTGIGIGFNDDPDADPIIGIVRNRGENGLQLQFVMGGKVATENYGTFTGNIGFRGYYGGKLGGDGTATMAWIEDPRLTWAVGGPLGLTLALGNGGPGGTGTMGDYDTGLDAGGGWGLAAQLKPIAGLTVAASAIYGPAQKKFDELVYAFGVKYSATDLLDVAANVNYNLTKTDDKEKLNAAFGVSILPIVKAMGFTALAFDARTNNGIGAAKSDIGVGERIGFATGALSLTLRARQLFWQGTDPSPDFIPMKFNLNASYKVSDLVTIGADGRYVIGSVPNFNWRHADETVQPDWNKDKSALAVSPYATFSLGGPSITLGYNLQKDMSEGAAAASGKPTMQHLIYGQIHVSF